MVSKATHTATYETQTLIEKQMTKLAENDPQGTANIADDRVLAPVFDWKSFKEYVNTYDPKKHGANDQRIIMHDMIYGIGLSIDKEKYQYGEGYRKFKQFLKELF